MSALEERNATRAEQGMRAMGHVARSMPAVYSDDAIGNAVDVLTDILHYCDTLTDAEAAEPLAEVVARVALANYRGERDGDAFS